MDNDKYPHIPYVTPRPYMTLDSGVEAQLSPELEKLLEDIYHTEIFVVCKDRGHAGSLMDECLRVFNWPDSTKAFQSERMIIFGREIIKFITLEQLDILCKGRHRTHVVWDFKVEEALNRCEKEKAHE